ncbi:hypothetical protein EVA_18148 [gut metagenome]|uniref:Uncharacterized protein n=1 Tax=gut metagenome TaxID=749906 RepID=J9FFQ1_9ZZZZ
MRGSSCFNCSKATISFSLCVFCSWISKRRLRFFFEFGIFSQTAKASAS